MALGGSYSDAGHRPLSCASRRTVPATAAASSTSEVEPASLPKDFVAVKGVDWALAVPASWKERPKQGIQVYRASGEIEGLPAGVFLTRGTYPGTTMEFGRYLVHEMMHGNPTIFVSQPVLVGSTQMYLAEFKIRCETCTEPVHVWMMSVVVRGEGYTLQCFVDEMNVKALREGCESIAFSLAVRL